MDYSHRVKRANDIPNAQPVRGRYDENAVRLAAQNGIIGRLRETVAQQAAEIERLRGCIAELEREGLDRAYTRRDYQNHGEPRADGRYEHPEKPVSFRRE